MAKSTPHEFDLSADEFVQCPYATYRTLHGRGGTAVDPAIGTAVGGYADLVALARDTSRRRGMGRGRERIGNRVEWDA